MWKYIVSYTASKGSSSNESLMTSNKVGSKDLNTTIGDYLEVFKETDVGKDEIKIKERKEHYQELVKGYYNLVTDFYEYGWGESFHFAPSYKGESFREAIARHEYYLAMRLGLNSGKKVLDCGCGVGGPMRAIAKFSGASVTGVTLNEYQVGRANHLHHKYGLEHLCQTEQGNFMDLGRANEFDAAYAIEATCHAPDKTKCFQEIYAALKPGGLVAVYEWAMTSRYDITNPLHRRVKHEIEKGDGLPDLPMTDEVLINFKDAGFEILESFDMAEEYESRALTVPWQATIQSGYSMNQWKHSRLGRWLTHVAVTVLEFLRIAPKGTAETHLMLTGAADSLGQGGELKIFTPMFFVLAKKPL